MSKTTVRGANTEIVPVGTKVKKVSGLPFKSTFRVATVKGIINHPHLPGIPAYTFEEDDSYVRCNYCIRVEE